MDKKLLAELVQSIKAAGKYVRGEGKASRLFEYPDTDVKAVRERIGLSQAQFAKMIRVSVKTLQNWEQRRRSPTGPAAALLQIVAKEPQVALRALHKSGRGRLQELPADVIVHPKLVVTRKSGAAILKQMKSGNPTKPLRDLMRDRD
jgi:putative transcriptional regulator